MATPIRGNFLTLLKLLRLQTIVNDQPDLLVFPCTLELKTISP
jgi:hypothetical protein